MSYRILLFVLIISACSPRIKQQPGNPGTAGPEAGIPSQLNILSYNIHHCNPPSAGALIDVDTIAGVIRKLNPDLVALQEVDVKTKRSGGVDQAALLGEKTGMKHYFFKAIDHDGGEYGLAILTRLEVSAVKQYPLPTIPETKGEPRILAMVTIKGKNGNDLVFACTHLDAQSNPQNRLLQIREIQSIAKNILLPVIIAGDLNAVTGTEVINIFDQSFTRTCNPCDFTIPVKNPNKTIDFIGFTPSSKFGVEKHEVISESYASDHLPVSVRLTTKPGR